MVRLSQHLALEQRLTPQQILLSTLLQLPMLSLEQKIKTEMELNPVLEEAEEMEDIQEEEEILDEDPKEAEEIREEFDQLENNNKTEEEEKYEELEEETNWEDLVNDEDNYEFRLPRDKNEEEYKRPEVSQTTMVDHLFEQLRLLNLSEDDFRVGEYIIYNLRDDGYLDKEVTVESIAHIFERNPEDVEKILKQIQVFDPVGIAARNLKECMEVQLLHLQFSGKQEIALKIVQEAFTDFVNKRYEKIVDQLGISFDDIREAIEVINKLNPKPGEGYWDSSQNYVIPDFTVEKVDNELIVSLNEWNIPGLRISPHYRRLIGKSKSLGKDVRQFLRKKVESAKWFINALYQRRVTMLKTMHAIVDLQRDFFEKGPEHIKPMIMKDVAEVINMDISTVSRVVNGKYVQTDYGVFELKYFFNEGMEMTDGEEISTLRIKEQLKEIIKNEDHNKPYSDDKLAEMLKKKGIPIARRTVAKYREQLGIPIARLRREI
ncbi:RNA polymerase sigma-54 factor [candidate division KSB1 bacterium 4484_188]|nr:MAG: RNA polymerase sigma-54 factor [candidate division KSB1 bacterium 4484_188]HFE65204.1 RNA polymerase sigma-54 factor [Caldithrix sp.]